MCSYFNCTIQELKPCPCDSISCLRRYFNCTIQELKPCPCDSISCLRRYFNCTIQELKQVKITIDFGQAVFQLHHTGIKTDKSAPCPVFKRKFQLHHTGIKTCNFLFIFIWLGISIAPYRN